MSQKALLALARSAGAESPEQSTIIRLVEPESLGHSAADKIADFSFTTDAVNFHLADFECPPELRAFADALLGIAGDREEFFATDASIGKRVGRSTKWVQRKRDEWTDWQSQQKVTFIKIEDNYTDRDGQRHSHKYVMYLSRLAVETVADAMGGSSWGKSAGAAIARSVRQRRSEVPCEAPRVHRGRKREPDAETIINSSLRTARTLMDKAANTVAAIKMRASIKASGDQLRIANGEASVHGSGTHFEVDPELISSLRRSLAALEAISGDGPTESTVSIPNKEKVDTGGASVIRGDGGQNVHIKTVHSEMAGAAFRSVGAESFHMFLKDEASGKAISEADFDMVSLGLNLPGYLERNGKKLESLIVRPYSERQLIQVDDCTPSVLNLLAPVSFLQIVTSEDNGQAFLALESVLDEEAFKTRTRLLAKLKPHGANGGAFGALRWPGSRNCKSSRKRADGTFPTVKIHKHQPGRLTTPEELERLGLLAPPAPSPQPTEARPLAKCAAPPYRWPDYQIELDRADGDRFKADMIFALRCLRWRWSESETAAKLREVSKKARERRNYAERTARRAAEIVGGV